jgi:hypothetical protein
MDQLTQPPLLHFIAVLVSLLYLSGLAFANIEGQIKSE